jgi:predicted nucleic acid-binding Zn finger protein
VGWQIKGVGHEVFLTEKGGDLKILVQRGGFSYFIIVEKNLTCNDYCYHAQEAGKAENLVHVAGKILNFNQQIDPKGLRWPSG